MSEMSVHRCSKRPSQFTLAVLLSQVLGMIGALCATLGAATHRFPWCRPAAFVGDLGALVGRGVLAGGAAETLVACACRFFSFLLLDASCSGTRFSALFV